MSEQARVVVIGGGVVGASVLYHLTKFGWSDVTLVERSELTSGSTWHAAGGFHTLNADTNMAALQGYTIRLYKELEEITGQPCGLHHVGGLTLAETPERLDLLRAERAKHRYMGLETEIVGPEQIRELSPITNTEGVLAALYDPLDGHLDPYGTTHAYAKAARANGAAIKLHTKVERLDRTPSGNWRVVTDKGEIVAQHVVNAAGLWAREVGRMAGVELPLHPMEHQYLITDDIPEIVERHGELPHVMDPQGESYLRQEGQGLVIGFYEQHCRSWADRGTSWDFGHELLPNDLERISDSLEFAFARYPVLQEAGIKQTINGPFTFAPDGNPLVGPVPGVPGFWSACAVMAGFSQGGGVGLSLAEWMVEGETSRDVFAMDVARFGDTCTKPYTRAKVMENYRRRFAVSYPNEELPAGRPLHTTPAYGLWDARRAVFGQGYGLEHVNYFAPEGEPRHETPTFRRSNAFPVVAEECRAVRTAVGINEIHNFAKYEVTGPNAAQWLDGIFANKLPKPGRLVLSPLLSPTGMIVGDFTIARIADDRFQLIAAYNAQAFHERWFEQWLPAEGVSFRNVSLDRLGFQIAGPNARALLDRVADGDVSNAGLPFRGVQEMHVGPCPALVQRVSFTGDLGYEIYVPAEHQIALFHTLEDAGRGPGEDLGLRPFGMRAIMSLRLEKSFGAWLAEYKPEYTPQETGLDRFVKPDKGAFVGREGFLAKGEPARKLATLVVEADDADVHGDEPVWSGDRIVGYVTSGGYGHWVARSIALAFVPAERIVEGEYFEVEILGDRRPATLTTQPLFDASAERMRG
jgi:dimethylglycine dehydrogenase